MFKNRFLKKLSIGVASLALVCPLALGATQSVNAKVRKPATTKIEKRTGNRHYDMPYAKKVAYSIRYDKKILNTKTARYYLWTQDNLIKNEKIMKSLNTSKKSNKKPVKKARRVQSPFKYVKNGKYVNHNKLSASDNAYVEVAPKAGIRAKYMKIGQPASKERVVKTQLLKQGTKLHVHASGSSFDWALSNKNLKSNYKPGRNVNYMWVY